MRRGTPRRQRFAVLAQVDEIVFHLIVFLMFAGLGLPHRAANLSEER